MAKVVDISDARLCLNLWVGIFTYGLTERQPPPTRVEFEDELQKQRCPEIVIQRAIYRLSPILWPNVNDLNIETPSKKKAAEVIDLAAQKACRDARDKVWIEAYIEEIEEYDVRMTQKEFEQNLRNLRYPERVVKRAISQLPPGRILSEEQVSS